MDSAGCPQRFSRCVGWGRGRVVGAGRLSNMCAAQAELRVFIQGRIIQGVVRHNGCRAASDLQFRGIHLPEGLFSTDRSVCSSLIHSAEMRSIEFSLTEEYDGEFDELLLQ